MVSPAECGGIYACSSSSGEPGGAARRWYLHAYGETSAQRMHP
ncbi:hypothetical protein [Paenibacillus chitinolyticus]|nr:hypothetical protein [Paenibacillus chitinolyticus]